MEYSNYYDSIVKDKKRYSFHCSTCEKWITVLYWDRHVKSEFHKKKSLKLLSINSENEYAPSSAAHEICVATSSEEAFAHSQEKICSFFCVECGTWITPLYWERHFKSESHLKRCKPSFAGTIEEYGGKAEFTPLTEISQGIDPLASFEQAVVQKQFTHLRIANGSITMCPHQHDALSLQGCPIFKLNV